LFCAVSDHSGSLNLENKLNITNMKFPGVYEIYDPLTGFSYFGESQCLFHRFSHHERFLRENSHHSRPLQEAYRQNPGGFSYFVLDSGPEWQDQIKRIERQDAYIKLKGLEKCFNIDESLPKSNLKITPVMVFGRRYASVREAARKSSFSRTTLRRYLDSGNHLEVYYLLKETELYGKVVFFGQKEKSPSLFFESYKECIEAGYTTNRQNAYRKIKRQTPGWRYAHVLPNGKPDRTPYTLKPGEMSYKEYINKNKQN
jgi:hypothetical protein